MVRMANRLLPTLAFIFLVLFAGGCASNHSFRAILLEEKEPDGKMKKKVAVQLLPTEEGAENTQNVNSSKLFGVIRDAKSNHMVGNNPAYVYSDGKFSIRIIDIRPGWLHAEKGFQLPDIGSNNKLTTEQVDHLLGRELWVVTHVHSLDNSDPLETKSKDFYHASNVKLDSASFVSLPLSDAERIVFTHNADSSYRVEFRVYEVNGFTLKSQIAKIVTNPGISGLLLTGAKALENLGASTLGASAMGYFTEKLEQKAKDEMLIERLILQAKGSLEFQGGINILLKDDEEHNAPLDKVLFSSTNNDGAKDFEFARLKDEYVLYDLFKSGRLKDAKFNTEDEYRTLIICMDEMKLTQPTQQSTQQPTQQFAKNNTCPKGVIRDEDSYKSTFIRFEIEQALQPEKAIAKRMEVRQKDATEKANIALEKLAQSKAEIQLKDKTLETVETALTNSIREAKDALAVAKAKEKDALDQVKQAERTVAEIDKTKQAANELVLDKKFMETREKELTDIATKEINPEKKKMAEERVKSLNAQKIRMQHLTEEANARLIKMMEATPNAKGKLEEAVKNASEAKKARESAEKTVARVEESTRNDFEVARSNMESQWQKMIQEQTEVEKTYKDARDALEKMKKAIRLKSLTLRQSN